MCSVFFLETIVHGVAANVIYFINSQTLWIPLDPSGFLWISLRNV